MGPSGSGKTTLMNIIGCLDTPTSGTYYLNEKLVNNLSDDELSIIRNKEIGFVFQSFHLLARNSALNNVMLPLRYAGMQESDAIVRAKEVLKEVGLSDRVDHSPSELSGGERQRVAVARALLLCPKVLLADEPTGQLDSKSAVQVVELLNELVDETGSLLCVVTHDESVAERVAGCPRGRRLRLFDGHLVA